MGNQKILRRVRIHRRIRKKVNGTVARPRLAVYRSNKQIYAQLIDDLAGHTLASASSNEAEIVAQSGTKKEKARLVGQLIAKRAQGAQIETVVFDRAGYLYHGRVKELADGAREAGLKF